MSDFQTAKKESGESASQSELFLAFYFLIRHLSAPPKDVNCELIS